MAVTPSSLFSFFSTRDAHDAQVIPPMTRSVVLMSSLRTNAAYFPRVAASTGLGHASGRVRAGAMIAPTSSPRPDRWYAPASSSAAATASVVSGASVVTVTADSPPGTSAIVTELTPARVSISSVTARTQCSQVIPVTWYVIDVMAQLPFPWGLRSGLHKAGDGLGCLADLRRRDIAA